MNAEVELYSSILADNLNIYEKLAECPVRWDVKMRIFSVIFVAARCEH